MITETNLILVSEIYIHFLDFLNQLKHFYQKKQYYYDSNFNSFKLIKSSKISSSILVIRLLSNLK